MIRSMPQVPNSEDFFAFQGGLDTATPAMSKRPGSVIESLNYEPNKNGGYSRRKGYERFDGRAAPSAAAYTLLACTLSSTPSVGATVTIGAATGLFVKAVTGGCVLTGVSGTIPASTNMTITGPVVVGVTAADTFLDTPITPAVEAQNLVDAADVYRALIAAVPGSGPVRGVCQYNGVVYAFRDNVGATAGQMYRSSGSGWTLVALGEEVSFTNANTSVGDGDTLTQGGVTATVQRVVVETGSLASGVNTGRLILSGRSGGNFAAGAATSTGGGALTLAGAQTAITLPPGGRYQFDIYNFFGQLSSRRMYGANGVGRCFEFDGTVFVPIRTGAANDTPSFILANRKYLYVAIGSSALNGSVGTPYRWVAGEGAVENAVGDTITGLVRLPGQALGIMTRNGSQALTGSSTSDWVLNTIRDDVGAVPYTVASMSDTYMLDDRGVMSLTTAQEYGNFADATLSEVIQKQIDAIRTKVVDSFIARNKGHYVLLMSDGSTLTMGVRNKRVIGFMLGQIGFTPTCSWSGEDTTGVERIFVGGSDGMVYEMDKGSTFDGAELEAYLKLSYYNSKSPRLRKTYRRLLLEMEVALYASLAFRADFSYGDPDVRETEGVVVTAGGTGGTWDFSDWDNFFWDSRSVEQPSIPFKGTGLNVALFFYSKTKLDFGHTLQGGLVVFSPRRAQR